MAQLGNITSANASVVVMVDTILPVGFKLEMFSSDQMFGVDEITVVEDRLGVDGNLAAGWVPSIKPVAITLEACSPSVTYMNTIYSAMEMNRTIYKVTMVATIPSIRKVYTWSNGVLKSGTPAASAKKVLDPTVWKFDFADFSQISY